MYSLSHHFVEQKLTSTIVNTRYLPGGAIAAHSNFQHVSCKLLDINIQQKDIYLEIQK
jgi:hypothetical protein